MVEYAPSNDPEAGKRRSTRVVQAIPITVTGVDALGQPFRERTSTLTVNCHGFKYQSKHYVLKGSSLQVEVPNAEAGMPARTVRCQVTFVQRPRSVKELFLVGVEMDSTGNVWGIAFPPEDWTPYAEAVRHDPARPTELPAPETTGETGGVPLQAFPPDVASELSTNIHRQVSRMLAGAQEQVKQIAREAALAAVSRETSTLLRDLNIQLKVAAEKAVEQTAGSHAEQAVRKAFKKIEEARDSSAQELRARWSEEFARQLQDASQQELGKLTESAAALHGVLARQVIADVTDAREQLKEIEERFAVAHRQREMETTSARSDWRAQLERDVTEARSQLAALHQEALLSAAQALGERVEAAGARAATLAEVEMEKREAEFRARMAAATSDAELRVAAEYANWDERLEHGKAFTAEIEAVLGQVKEESRELESQAQRAGAEVANQVNSLLAENRAKLEQQAESILAALTLRLEPALAERGAAMVTRATAEAEKLIESQVRLAKEAIQDLRTEEAAVMELLQQEQARVRVELENAGQTILGHCMEELEAKSNDATHETFEQLYKSAEWYQRKAQTAMQTAFDKGMAQVTTRLREKAGEISTLFAAELDHYSRSYSEHTQGLLEEAAKELTQKVRGQVQDTLELGAAQFRDDVHRLAEGKLGELRQISDAVVQDAQASFAEQAEKARVKLDSHSSQSVTEFQQNVAERLRQSVSEALEEFQRRLAPVLDDWRAEARAQQAQWINSLEQQRDASVGQFKHRLENVSNSWMVAAVSTLNQHSQEVFDSMAHSAEQRLRTVCADVFAGVGETMRQRLLEISADLKKSPKS